LHIIRGIVAAVKQLRGKKQERTALLGKNQEKSVNLTKNNKTRGGHAALL
jgi:hypothetical protein